VYGYLKRRQYFMVIPDEQKKWAWRVVVLILVIGGLLQVVALFQEPEARAVALGYFASGATIVFAWLNRRKLQQLGRSRISGDGRRFILIGSLGAVWVETAFWAAEKLTGAVGVAASPNLLIDLLVTMPWYVSMLAILWIVYRRHAYHWTTVALLGGVYELGADGILGRVLGGNVISFEYLLQLVLFFGVFVIVYSPIVLPPVWSTPQESSEQSLANWRRVFSAFLPLLPLIPYGIILIMLFG
jgi:hypothetical protein